MLSGSQECEKWYWLKWLRRLYGRGGNWTVICCYISQLLLVINNSKTLVVQCNKHFVLLTTLDLMWGGSAELTYASVASCGSLGGLDDLGWTLPSLGLWLGPPPWLCSVPLSQSPAGQWDMFSQGLGAGRGTRDRAEQFKVLWVSS